MEKQLTVVKKKSKCGFCGIHKNDYLRYGPMYKLGKLTAHYYCVLLSNRLIQNGNDDEGILGFLLSDIEDELRRTSEVLCFYCKKGTATIKCAASKCKKSFHLPCGLKKGTSHEFLCQFKSFCHFHRHIQNIPEEILKEAYNSKVICCICQEEVNVRSNRKNILWAPCCLKAWYHRLCVQELAHNAGYFCRCPACNDSKKFNEWMQRNGIFIPQQDASWEQTPNAFDDLLFRYNSCDAKQCKCPRGRNSSTNNTIWEIILCESCGSQGIHVACGDLKFFDTEWECIACSEITKSLKRKAVKMEEGSSKQLKVSEVAQKKRRRSSEDLGNSVLDKRKKCRTEPEEEEVEVDVVTIEDEEKEDETFPVTVDKSKEEERLGQVRTEEANAIPKIDAEEVLKRVKPGPLSYKLAAVRKIMGSFPLELERIKDEKSSSSVIEVIELSDSEEEKETKDDIEIIEEKELPKFL